MKSRLGLPLGSSLGGDKPAASDVQATRERWADVRLGANGLEMGASGDYAEVDGDEALRQWVITCLSTTPGTFRLRPTFGAGLKEWVKKPLTSTNLSAIRHRCVEQLLTDDRIDSVSIELAEEVYDDKPALRVVPTIDSRGRSHRLAPIVFVRS